MIPIMPMALEAFDLTGFDLIISSEAGPAKGIIPGPDSLHICYCHSPMRYIWDLYPQYYNKSGILTKFFMAMTSPYIRTWDVTTSSRVDHFIANSRYVAKRIMKFYRRESTVIHPPVDTSKFSPGETSEDFYLCAGQITPYKKIELAVEAFSQMGKRLIVAGSGATPDLIKRGGKTVTFLGAVSDTRLRELLSTCRALIYPGIEDFGIIPLEAMASGRPVIAFAAGGAMDTVIDGETGILFHAQTVESLTAAVKKMEETHSDFHGSTLRNFAATFDRSQFKAKLAAHIDDLLKSHYSTE